MPLYLTATELEARLAGFVREHLRTKSPETTGTYRRSLNSFIRYVEESGKPFQFSPAAVEAYKQSLEYRGCSAVTVSTYLTALRRFCQYLVEIGVLSANPAANVRGNARPAEHSRDTLSAEEVAMLLEHLKGDTLIDQRDRAVVHAMLFAGLSEIELVRADVGDIDQTLMGSFLRVQGKGRAEKDRQVPLDAQVLRPVEQYLASRNPVRPEEPLFTSHGHRSEGERLNPRTVRSRVNRLLRLAGLKRPGISPHSLTHTAPLLWLEQGMPVEEISRRMRHGTPETTRIYLREREQRLREAAATG